MLIENLKLLKPAATHSKSKSSFVSEVFSSFGQICLRVVIHGQLSSDVG